LLGRGTKPEEGKCSDLDTLVGKGNKKSGQGVSENEKRGFGGSEKGKRGPCTGLPTGVRFTNGKSWGKKYS